MQQMTSNLKAVIRFFRQIGIQPDLDLDLHLFRIHGDTDVIAACHVISAEYHLVTWFVGS